MNLKRNCFKPEIKLILKTEVLNALLFHEVLIWIFESKYSRMEQGKFVEDKFKTHEGI